MTDIDTVTAALQLPPISQIGIVVHDVAKTAERYTRNFGVGPFNVYEFVADKAWCGEQPCAYRIKVGKAMLGSVEWELMEPTEGISPFRDHLEQRGEGLQHLGFLVSDYDGIMARFVSAGFRPVFRVETYSPQYNGIVRACCFDTMAVGGVMLEIAWKSWLAAR